MTTGDEPSEFTYPLESPITERGQTERLEVRLDRERHMRLREVAAVYEVPRSEMVRMMIDDAYEELLLERRRAAVRRIVAAQTEGEEMPDPDELSRQLAETYAVRLDE